MDPAAKSMREDILTETTNVARVQLSTKRLKEDWSLLNHNPRRPKQTWVGDPDLLNEYIPQRNALGVQMYYGRKELGKRMRAPATTTRTNDEMMYHNSYEFLDAHPVNVDEVPKDHETFTDFPNVVELDSVRMKDHPMENEVSLNKYKTAGDLVNVAKTNFMKKTYVREDAHTDKSYN